MCKECLCTRSLQFASANMPAVRGAGSFDSPIVISDDEDEAAVESQLRAVSNSNSPAGADEVSPPSLSPTLNGCSTAGDSHVDSNIAQSVGYSMALRMGFLPGHGLGFALDGGSSYSRPLSLTRSPLGRVEPISVTFKRKRTDSGIGFQNNSEDSESRFQTSGTNDERKKLKPNHPSSQASEPRLVRLQTTKFQKPTSFKGKEKPTVVGPPPSQQEQPPATLSPSHATPSDPGPSKTAPRIAHTSPVESPSMEPPPLLPYHYHDPFAVYPSYMASGLQEMWPPPWVAFPTPPCGSWTPFFSEMANVANTPTHSTSNSGTVKLPEVTGSNCGSHPSQPTVLPKNNTSIGRGPEADPLSTHGAYSKPVVPPPNPSCTLVLDAIPPRFRSAAWLETWAANASLLPAARVDIDSKKGKGLVEFPDAVTARKAFNSKQLRGKGRHSIKAWWYRASGAASAAALQTVLNNGAGELEDGEILEISASEAVECTAPSPKRLTRKQKKKQKNLDTTQRLNQPGSLGRVDGPIFKECVTREPADSATEPASLPHTTAESSEISLAPSLAHVYVTSLSSEQDDVEDIAMASPPTSDLPSVVPPLMEIHTTPNSTESQQCEVVTASSTADNVHSEPLVPAKDSATLSPLPLQAPEPQHIVAPSRIPSEPRSFRSPPVGPSFTKRSLLARQRELEGKINQSKLALEKMHKTPGSAPVPATPGSFSPPPIPSPTPEGASDDGLSMEQNLRRLVLESKKGRTKPPVTPTDPGDLPPKPPIANDNIPTLPYSTVSTSATFCSDSLTAF